MQTSKLKCRNQRQLSVFTDKTKTMMSTSTMLMLMLITPTPCSKGNQKANRI